MVDPQEEREKEEIKKMVDPVDQLGFNLDGFGGMDYKKLKTMARAMSHNSEGTERKRDPNPEEMEKEQADPGNIDPEWSSMMDEMMKSDARDRQYRQSASRMEKESQEWKDTHGEIPNPNPRMSGQIKKKDFQEVPTTSFLLSF